MSERTKLLKKAVLTSVGASTNVNRIRDAISEAMEDLVKVGQDLLEDLEEKGKVKSEAVQDFLKQLRSEAGKKTHEVERKVTGTLSESIKKAVNELGLVTREQFKELSERVAALEEGSNDGEGEESKKTRVRGKRNSTAN